MYKRVTRSRIRVVLAAPAYLRVRNYLNNYFAMYTRLTLFAISVELAFPAKMALGII